jgi:hypothetical protein
LTLGRKEVENKHLLETESMPSSNHEKEIWNQTLSTREGIKVKGT